MLLMSLLAVTICTDTVTTPNATFTPTTTVHLISSTNVSEEHQQTTEVNQNGTASPSLTTSLHEAPSNHTQNGNISTEEPLIYTTTNQSLNLTTLSPHLTTVSNGTTITNTTNSTPVTTNATHVTSASIVDATSSSAAVWDKDDLTQNLGLVAILCIFCIVVTLVLVVLMVQCVQQMRSRSRFERLDDVPMGQVSEEAPFAHFSKWQHLPDTSEQRPTCSQRHIKYPLRNLQNNNNTSLWHRAEIGNTETGLCG